VLVDDSYATCKSLNRQYGSTYYWATMLLPPAQRRHVHALYAFCRYADDIVDVRDAPVTDRRSSLQAFGDQFFEELLLGHSSHPVLAAVIDTVRVLDIDPDCFRRFLHSMDMDFTVHTYETFDDLMVYMDGSAAVIGEMMLPVLRPLSPSAINGARDLGIAFQLTNFLRDVGEDLDRGRVYIPQSTLRQFSCDISDRSVNDEWINVMRFEIDRTRSFYTQADDGIALLTGRAKDCVLAARRLYSGILDRIEQNRYDVFSKRARVSRVRKVAAASRLVRPTRRWASAS
jgi:phytoene synthase